MRNRNGVQLSGYTYVKAKSRVDPATRGYWFALILRRPEKCAHGGDTWDERDLPTICTKCAESWSWDHDLAMHSTTAGRRLAEELGLNPLTAGADLRYRDGYEKDTRPAVKVST